MTTAALRLMLGEREGAMAWMTARAGTMMACVAALAAGCVPALAPAPGKGGPVWRELTSEHFTMWTNAEPSRAREMIQQMEHLRQVIVGVAFPSTPARGRVMVFALRDDDELRAASPIGEPRAFARPAQFPLWPPVIVVSAFSNRSRGDTILAHEVTHVISFGILRHQPRWLAEGMAPYFETVELDPGSATADVGRAPQRRGAAARQAHLIPISRLLGWTDLGKHEQREYSTAWALFTFLINQHREELLRYMQLLQREGTARDELTDEDARRLWAASFPSLPLGEVDAAMRQWLLVGHHTILHFNVRRNHWPVAERELRDADVHAARAYLHLTGRFDRRVRADVEAALEADPSNVLANVLAVGALDRKLTIEEARAIAAAHPGDFRAWLLVLHVLEEGNGDASERAASRAKVCSLIAHNPALIAPKEICEPLEDGAQP